MRADTFSTTDLNQLQRQLATWRGKQSGRARLPDAVWRAAAELARTRGPSTIARTLRLDYYKLRQRLAQSLPAVAAPAAFVELKVVELSGAPASESSVELCEGTARMTLRVRGDAATLVALAESFWRRPR